MATTRVLSRLLVPKNLHRLSTIGTKQEQIRRFWHHHHSARRELPMISNVMEQPDGSKKFHLSLNVNGFEPDEIKIKAQNGTITISARKEAKQAKDTYVLQEFSQTYTLPEGIKLDDLKSTYTQNGILSIEAPLLPKDPPKERTIKIDRA